MIPSLGQLLRTVEVIDGPSAGNLQMFGLRWHGANRLTYRTLDEALAVGKLEITEISESGSVPLLKAINRDMLPVFLLAGEQLVGAKQNRILNTSLLIPGRTELVIPVSCVEAGRWGYRSPRFTSPGSMSHTKLRKLLSGHVHDSYARTGWATSQQSEVWHEVRRKLHGMESASPSAALQQTYVDHATRIEDVLGQLPLPAECCGVAFASNGHMAGIDLFDCPATLAKLGPKLVRAYVLDSLETQGQAFAPLAATVIRDWLSAAAEIPNEIHKSPGLGHDVRLRGQSIVGASLIVENCPIHAELFALDAEGS